VIGRHVSILHPPEDAEEQLENIRSVMESGGTWSGEFEVNHRDGTPGVVEAVVVPLRDDRGVQIGFIGVNRDVTERKRAENDLRESEEKFRMLLHSTAEAIYGIDMEGNCTFCNPSTLRFLGYEHTEQLLGRNMHDLAHHTRPDGSVCPKSECEIFRALREGKGTHRDDEMLWRSDGTNFAAEYWSYPIEKNGERIGAVVTFLDISERRSAEKALHESEEKYRDLVENASYGIFRAKRDGSLLDVNPAFVAMLAYETKDDVLKLNLSRDVYENPEEREAILRRCESFGERVSSELNFRRKDGDFVTVKMNGRAVRDPSGDVAYFEVIAEDVTEQRKLEEQFRQAQKMEALGRLAGGIAHDFNNVLMVVSSYAEMILARGALDSTVERYTSNIMNAGRRAASLINQLLAFSRKQMLQPTTLDLAVVVAEMDQMLSRILGEDVETSLVIEPALGKVHADRTQIEQIVMNLVVNARDAMPGGGKLRIELQNVTVDTDYLIRHRNVKTGEYVMLAISDSGTGMDSVTKAKIFEPFFTTKEVGKGTGLGLATVYGIVKQSGGFIWVYSEPGFGSAFKVYLPRVNREATPIRESAEESKMLKGSGETVLLVDDDSDLRSAAREFLDAKGYRVLEAESGAAALHVCSSCERPIRVLVTDLIMPGMRGVELAAKIAELHPEVAIVYMSGYTDRFEDVADLGPGATFLQKPFSLSTLAIRLHTALQRRTPTESPQSETTNEQL
ncbi:MAG: PAS domain S-box protein, partial [Terriglobales bacterium]